MRGLLRIVVAGLAWFTTAALAASDVPAAPASALDTPLTREATRDLVSRLSDAEVRKLLIEQLDRAAPRAAPASDPGMGMMGTMADNAVMWRTRVAELVAAVRALPATAAVVTNRLFVDVSPVVVWTLLAAMLVAGAVAEFLWRRATHKWRARHTQLRQTGFFERALRRATGLAVDVAGLLAFAAGALALFFAA